MADNITIPATGSGTAAPVVSTDDCGAAGHVQRVKIAYGADGDATQVPADAQGLSVKVASAVTLGVETAFQHDSPIDVPQGLWPLAGRAKAAAPADVSADSDHVAAWYLRNGAAACVITAAGALVGGDATNGLDVDVTRIPGQYVEDGIPAGGDIGLSVLAVRRDTPASSAGSDGDWATPGLDNLGRLWVAPSFAMRKLVTVTPTISTSPAYTAGDQVGGVMTFTNAALVNGGAANIVGATISNRGAQNYPALELWIFQVSPTMVGADNGAFDLTDANLEAGILLGVADLYAWTNTSAGQVTQGAYRGFPLSMAPLPVVCGAATTSVYGVLKTGTVFTGVSTTDLVVTLMFDR